MILQIVSLFNMEKMNVVLDREINITIDRHTVKEFKRFTQAVYCRDEEHVKFLSGNLIGIHTPLFLKTDENYFWDSIIEVDKKDLSREFHHPNTIVHKEWNIAGDLMNNVMVWLIHLALVSKLKEDEKMDFIKDILIFFQYKFLTSKIQRDYGYGAKPATATAAYDSLGGHFLIKQCDSWMEYFKIRADRMIAGDGEGKHKDMMGILKSYQDDNDVKNVISGIANNMNTMMKAYNVIFHALHNAGTGISLSSSIALDKEGVDTASDITTGYGRYIRILDSRIGIREEFINYDLLQLIIGETTARERKVKDLLDFITDNYGNDRYKEVYEFVNNGIIFAFTELFDDNVEINDIRSVVKVLLGKMSARRSGNDVFDKYERYGRKVLKRSIGDNKHGLTARNVSIVYMVVWTLLSDKEI